MLHVGRCAAGRRHGYCDLREDYGDTAIRVRHLATITETPAQSVRLHIPYQKWESRCRHRVERCLIVRSGRWPSGWRSFIVPVISEKLVSAWGCLLDLLDSYYVSSGWPNGSSAPYTEILTLPSSYLNGTYQCDKFVVCGFSPELVIKVPRESVLFR